MPPDFWAKAASAAVNANDSAPVTASTRRSRLILLRLLFNGVGSESPLLPPRRQVIALLRRGSTGTIAQILSEAEWRYAAPTGPAGLLVEPDVLEARAVVDAVDHQGQPLDPR